MNPLSSNPPPTLPAPKKPKSTGAKIFIGCLIVLFVLGLIFVGLMVAGGLWFFSPGKQVEPARLVAPEAETVIRFDGLSGDTGFKALASRFVMAAQAAEERNQENQLPENLRWLEGFRQMQNAQGAANIGNALDMYLPKQAVLAFEPGEDGASAEPLFIANFQRFVRPVRFFVEKIVADSPDSTTETYRGRKILDLDRGPAMVFEGGTFLLAGEAATLKRALDRLDQPAAPHVLLSQLDETGGTVGREWDVAGVSSSPQTSLAALSMVGFEAFGEDGANPFAELRNLRWAVDAVSGDEVGAELSFDYGSPEAAVAALAGLESRWAGVAARAAERGLALAAATSQEGPRLTTRLELTGLANAITAWMSRPEAPEEEMPVEEIPVEEMPVEASPATEGVE